MTPKDGLMSEVSDKVRKIVGDNLGFAFDDVKPESRFVEDLNADSLDVVEIVMALEEGFNLEIDEDAAGKMATVQDAISYIEKRKNS